MRSAQVAFVVLCTLLNVCANLSVLKLTGNRTLPPDASHFLDPALASFSIETAFFEEFVGNISEPNGLTERLLNNIKARTGVPPEIRIGGITADSTHWDPNLNAVLSNFIDKAGTLQNTTIGPGFWDSVKLLPQGTKVTMDLDLQDLDFRGALSMAQAAETGLGSDQLILFEIGNEPDHYLQFTANNYSSVWGTWAKNISDNLGFASPRFQVAATAEDPLWPFNAPGASSALDCVSALAAGANRDGVVKTCSEHTYQYSVCDPPRTSVATLPNLVNHTHLAMYLDLWQPRIHSIRDTLGSHSFMIGEYNSISCSGKDGVSNTFGQALWLLDTIFYAASLNITRLYLHQGGPLALQSQVQLNEGGQLTVIKSSFFDDISLKLGLSFYDMWYPVQNLNGPAKVFPSYATYLFVAETLGDSKTLQVSNLYPGRQTNGSSITTAMGDQSSGQLVAYGFWDVSNPSTPEFPTKLALLNLEIYNQTQTDSPRPSSTFDISGLLGNNTQVVRVRKLQAPGADVQDANVTSWAGQTFETGVARGKLVEDSIQGGKIIVQASEAVLVFL